MTWLQGFVSVGIFLNSLVFIVATKAVFRADKAGISSYAFMASFGALLSITLWHLYQYPASNPEQLVCAFGMAVVSCSLFFWSSNTIKKRPFTVIFSPDTPEMLNQDGPYQYIRHPFYTSYLLNFFAAFLATDRCLAPLGTFFIILGIYLYAASAEEKKFLNSVLRDQYLAYRKHTGMFMPRLMGW